jgi:competence protein ComFB
MPVTIYNLREELVNENEKKVMDLVTEMQKKGELPCSCRDCLLDITALSLNKLKPRYMVSLLKELAPRPEREAAWNERVKEVVKAACERVRERPHH